jgi:hypothetical protein
LCSAALAACGDDSGGGGSGSEDGGVSVADIDEINNLLEDLGGDLGGLSSDVDDLGAGLDEVGSNLDDVSGTVDDLGMRVDDLENPVIPNCSDADFCIPNGVDFVSTAVTAIVARLCALEVDCCTADELNYKFGPGITDVDTCTDTFVDLINNGFSPDFLQSNAPAIRSVIEIAQAVNNPEVHVEVDDAGVAACLAHLEARECPKYAAGVTPPTRCSPPTDYVGDPCALDALLNGLNEVGELCAFSGNGVPECVDGAICRRLNQRGICANPAEEGDHCIDDSQCDREMTGLFCNHATGQCQALGLAGDACAYVDDTFARDSSGIDHGSSNGTSIDCAPGHSCDPASKLCVLACSAGALCNPNLNNTDCPDNTVCNVTEFPQLNVTTFTGVVRYGVCRAPTANGASCSESTVTPTVFIPRNQQCASGRCGTNPNYSAPPDPLYVCLAARAAAGAACPGGVPNALDGECEFGRCDRDTQCSAACNGPGTCPATDFCDLSAPLTGVGSYGCETKVADGVACRNAVGTNTHDSCQSGYCDQNTFLCAAKVASGTACASGVDQQCPAGEWCNAGTCQALYAAGATCTAYPTRCIADHTCAGDNVCRPTDEYPNGAPCTGDTQCASDFCAGTVCAAPIADGADCDVTSATSGTTHKCGASSYCKYDPSATTRSGKCTARGLAGQACDPRFYQQNPSNADCMGILPCELRNDMFVCGTNARPADTLFCDGT